MAQAVNNPTSNCSSQGTVWVHKSQPRLTPSFPLSQFGREKERSVEAIMSVLTKPSSYVGQSSHGQLHVGGTD